MNECQFDDLCCCCQCAQTAKELSDQVKDRVKELGYARYKLLVQVTIGEKKGQGIRLASRCMWDTSTDNCASESFETEALFCVAQVGFVRFWRSERELQLGKRPLRL